MELYHRQEPKFDYVHPEKELYAGIWSLYAGATAFLAARLWVKTTRRHGLWYDDYILIVCWIILTGNNMIITVEYATGYVTPTWDDRMRVLIIISSCGTLLNQSLTKTAFAVTLLKLTRGFSTWKICHAILWFCIVSMCSFNLAKIVVEWARVCNKDVYNKPYRLDFCLKTDDRSKFKEGGNYYNVIMDFIFALFPWVITWNLDMRRREKVGLCITMSLGMVVAIESAIRNEWKYNGNADDRWYFWRNAMSNIWYSSEITGTIIVQCIPVLRPLVQEVKTSLRSKRLGSMTIDADESGGMPLDQIGGREWYRPPSFPRRHRLSFFGGFAAAAPERQR
ncbi:hypothetical protein BST61_g2262 [Cercospora zeina]